MTETTTAAAATTPRELTIDANGMRFGALAWGDDDAPLALLVHGYPDTAWTWRHLGPLLAERGWRAVAPFTRGYGPTDLAPDDDYSVPSQAADIVALHTALGGDAQSALVGHDWGAVATHALTGTHPGLFGRVVTLAVPPASALLRPWAPRSPRPHVGVRQLRKSWYLLFNQVPGVSDRAFEQVVDVLWRTWSPGYDAVEDIAHVRAALDGVSRRRAALRYYRTGLAPRAGWTLFRAKGSQPVLFLYGDQDGCIDAEVSADAALPAGSERRRLPGIGHFLHLEAPELVGGLVADWLGTPPARTAAASR